MFGIPVALLIRIGAFIGVLLLLFGLYEADNHWCNQACKNQKERADSVQLAYDTAVSKANATIATLESGAVQLTKKYELISAEKDAQTKIAKDAINAKIKASKELADLRLSADIVRVFNESANQGRTHTEDPTATKQGDASSTNSSQGVTGTALFDTINENNANHWATVKQVEDWQNFWNDYKNEVIEATGPE